MKKLKEKGYVIGVSGEYVNKVLQKYEGVEDLIDVAARVSPKQKEMIIHFL